jgi:hypothetical protein
MVPVQEMGMVSTGVVTVAPDALTDAVRVVELSPEAVPVYVQVEIPGGSPDTTAGLHVATALIAPEIVTVTGTLAGPPFDTEIVPVTVKVGGVLLARE